jgi:hypothetical protein
MEEFIIKNINKDYSIDFEKLFKRTSKIKKT